jgi:hypothetical protein
MRVPANRIEILPPEGRRNHLDIQSMIQAAALIALVLPISVVCFYVITEWVVRENFGAEGVKNFLMIAFALLVIGASIYAVSRIQVGVVNAINEVHRVATESAILRESNDDRGEAMRSMALRFPEILARTQDHTEERATALARQILIQGRQAAKLEARNDTMQIPSFVLDEEEEVEI